MAKQKPQHRDGQIDAALKTSIEHMKSHAEVMKKAGAHQDALAKHRQLQQKHAAARAGGPAAAQQKGGRKNTRKRVSVK